MRPKPSPPAAPAPGVSLSSLTSRPIAFATTSAYLLSAASSCCTISGVAPFCGPYTADAPLGPVSGLSTSHATTNSHSRSSIGIPERSTEASPASAAPPGRSSFPSASTNFAPSACAIPAPPSLVALPPIPMMNLRQPLARAAAISSPVPRVVVMRGSRRSRGTRGSPDAEAISITAVRPSPRIP